MSGLSDLQEALPRWVELVRRPGQPMVETRDLGDVVVTEVTAFPEAEPDRAIADVHFVGVAARDLPDRDTLVGTVVSACGEGEFQAMQPKDLAGGPSYVVLGGWLGSQDLALMLIGAVELAGVADAITPGRLGIKGPEGDNLAGLGMVMLGPSTVWVDEELGREGAGEQR